MAKLLNKCEFCGCRGAMPHNKYVDRCEECGKRYARYISAKSRKHEKALDNVIDEYKVLDNLGYKVPRALKGVSKR